METVAAANTLSLSPPPTDCLPASLHIAQSTKPPKLSMKMLLAQIEQLQSENKTLTDKLKEMELQWNEQLCILAQVASVIELPDLDESPLAATAENKESLEPASAGTGWAVVQPRSERHPRKPKSRWAFWKKA